jgi:hypothetical protein
MKLFRKRLSTLPSGEIGKGSSAIINAPSNQGGMYPAASPDKEEARRRFMQRLYQLSKTHGSSNVKGVPAELVLKMSEASANSSLADTTRTTPAIATSLTPVISPYGSPVPSATPSTASSRSRTKDINVTKQVENSPTSCVEKQDNQLGFNMTLEPGFVETQHIPLDFGMTIEPGCLAGSVQSVISQFAACTDDFFGDKHAATRCDREPRIPVAIQEETRCIMSVPSTITFGPSGGALVDVPLDPRPKRKYIFEDELDSIVANSERRISSSVTDKISDREGTSVIDNVWVVSSFAEEKVLPGEEFDAVSMTSSIPTRNSHVL